MTPEELRALADAATPGPLYTNVEDTVGGWLVANVDKRGHAIDVRQDSTDRVAGEFTREQDARLFALAPDLARLCADWVGVLEDIRVYDPRASYVNDLASNALAQLMELKAL